MPITLDCPHDVLQIAAKIVQRPTVSNAFDDLNLFTDEFLFTRKAAVEIEVDKLCLVPTSKWCCPDYSPGVEGGETSLIRDFEVPHTKVTDTIRVCDVEGKTEFMVGLSQSDLIDVTSLELKRGAKIRAKLDLTLKYRKFMAATRGLILDADGSSVILDLFKFFGINQMSINLPVSDATLNPYTWVAEYKKQLSKALLGQVATRAYVFLTSTDFNKLMENPGFAKHYLMCCNLGDQVRAAMAASNSREFTIDGVTFKEFWEPTVCNPITGENIVYMTDGIGHGVPVVQGMYVNYVAPAMRMGTIHKQATSVFEYTRADLKDDMDEVVGVKQKGEMNALPFALFPAGLFKVLVV